MLTIALVALAVGADNFGAAIGLGLTGVDSALRVKVATVFGAFEGGMPVVGILIGRAAAGALGTEAPIVAGVLLGAMGVYSIVSSAVENRREASGRRGEGVADASNIWRMLVLGLILSLDNLVIGFALGSDHVNLVAAIGTIAVVSTLLSLLGLELGSRLGKTFGDKSEYVGGAILVVIGVAVGTGII